jgi:hypothetical protein
MRMISPWVCGLKINDFVWVTIVDLGMVPVWKLGTVVDLSQLLNYYTITVKVENLVLKVHQHDVRSKAYMNRNAS